MPFEKDCLNFSSFNRLILFIFNFLQDSSKHSNRRTSESDKIAVNTGQTKPVVSAEDDDTSQESQGGDHVNSNGPGTESMQWNASESHSSDIINNKEDQEEEDSKNSAQVRKGHSLIQ